MKLNFAGLVTLFGSAATFVSLGGEPTSTANPAPKEDWISEIVPIKHERAADIAAALNSLTSQYHGLGTNWLASKRDAENVLSNAWAKLSPQFKEMNEWRKANDGADKVTSGNDPIVADERTNAVLIHTHKRDLNILKETIARLDAAREGVLIEGVVFEVAVNGTNSAETICFGGPGGPGGSGSEFHHLAANAQRGAAETVGSVGAVDVDFDAMIKQLADRKEVKILQRPRIQTADGVAATLFVGDSRYCCRSGESGVRADDSRHSMNEVLGVTLEISPTITTDRKLRMSIGQTIEKYAGTTNVAKVGSVPITSRQSLQTEVAVADRQTIVIAGPVEQTQDKLSKGVPVLKSTPLIGGLFRNHPRKMQVETLLMVRASILPPN